MPRKSLMAITFVTLGIFLALMASCKNKGPIRPYDQPAPTPTPITGAIDVYVEDTVAIPGVTIIAVPPSNSVTFTEVTGNNGTAYFNPVTFETGVWGFTIPQQKYFATSFTGVNILGPGQTVTFTTGPTAPSISFTPTSATNYFYTSGVTVSYNVVYSQSGNLLVPINFVVSPSWPTNWTSTYMPLQLGNTNVGNAALTVAGSTCVNQNPVYQLKAFDGQSTPIKRSQSSSVTITKTFPSNVYLILNYVGGAGPVTGTLSLTTTNACSDTFSMNGYIYWMSHNTYCCAETLTLAGGIGLRPREYGWNDNFSLIASTLSAPITYRINANNLSLAKMYAVITSPAQFVGSYDCSFPVSAGSVTLMNVSY